MDISSLLTSMLMSSDSMQNMGSRTNTSTASVEKVLGAALPLLMNGAREQSEREETAAGFAGALEQHAQSDLSDLSSFFKGVDLDDGAKIIGHLLGGNTAASTRKIARSTGVSTAETRSILSAAAPMLMSLLGQETKKQQSSSSDALASIAGALLRNIDVGDLLVDILGGTTKKKTTTRKKTTKKDNGEVLEAVGDLLGALLK